MTSAQVQKEIMEETSGHGGREEEHKCAGSEQDAQCEKVISRGPSPSIVHDAKGLVDEARVGVSLLCAFRDHRQRLARA
jgi:hypothetical protein